MTTQKTYEGRVIFYDKSKGFGRIQNNELGNVFLHQSKFVENYKMGHANDLVSYEVIPSTKKPGVFEAINVRFVKNENLQTIIEAFAEKSNLKGKVLKMNAGGLLMDIYGIEVFLPKSEVDIFEFNSYTVFLNKDLDVRVISMDDRSVVVSRKVILEEEETSYRHSGKETHPHIEV
ncbi:MAG TPA: hypothetical protein DCQ93_07615 [Bacteroidetes bacterium]|nr:hypothetical protein [Bacteroidota bacterium]